MCNSSSTMDLNLMLMTAGATAHLASVEGQRSLPLDCDFYVGYKKIAIQPNEVVVSIEIPFTTEVSFNIIFVVSLLTYLL